MSIELFALFQSGLYVQMRARLGGAEWAKCRLRNLASRSGFIGLVLRLRV